ncbi:MAG: hypothetical protein KBD17_00695 [Candidatus Pacebacteria bacterium]|nr:hypothetical protein [Candidatus Paceibacterota bacterium]
MEPQTTNQNKKLTENVHFAMSQGYMTYFVLFLFGVFLDIFFHFKFFPTAFAEPAGITLLVLATVGILWAQNTSKKLNTVNVTKETFCQGPYCYTRTPTHWGLFFLVLGFGILVNAFFVVVTTIVSFIVSKFIFLRRGEAILAKKYGTPYLEYKKQVKL